MVTLSLMFSIFFSFLKLLALINLPLCICTSKCANLHHYKNKRNIQFQNKQNKKAKLKQNKNNLPVFNGTQKTSVGDKVGFLRSGQREPSSRTSP